ncbi:hypothetical protein R70006_06239 [Paraburkholderia domus]|uniref:hypothetical protein n=1 Tax=Paraburkholderia domus TaxID=2793075 RepID=UPI00191293A1|nr:hypothetical protein [Paraburkholderia domus]MBK5052870.1 hypothetical protein [Burkholderia sp. R-70006]CAE6821842.1 hypothetical protein R70006_06239 [Paraburkholderia domus]
MQPLSHSVLAVGQPSPFPSAGVGAMAVAAPIHHGVLTLVVQLPDVSAKDLNAITGDPFALALYQTSANPIGTMMLALKCGGENSWPLKAPILDTSETLLDWATRPQEGNTLLVVLVESTSNTIRALRTVGLPPDFLKLVQDGILSCKTIDPGALMMSSIHLTVDNVWKEGQQWLVDPQANEFRRR